MPLRRIDRWREIRALELVDSGEEYFPLLKEKISHAKHSVYLETYIFSGDSQAEEVAEWLCQAARRGIDVKVVIDWIGSSAFSFGEKFDQAGVQWRFYNPKWFGTFGFSRTHRKIVVFDDHEALVGGINICSDDLSMFGKSIAGPRWDLALLASGPVAEKVQVAFLRQWQRLQIDAFKPGNVIKRLLEHESPWTSKHFMPVWGSVKQSLIAFIARDNLHHRRDIERSYLKAIGQARQEIWLANPYFVPGRFLSQALIHAAQRGVRVHLLLGHNEYTIFDWATPSLYGRFIKAGIEIHEYQKGLLHLKAMVVDDRWATLGSSNCDPLSFLVNHEANFVLVNHPIIKSIKSKICDRSRQHARQVSSSSYASRPLFVKMMNWFTYVALRLLVRLIAVGTRDRPLSWQGE